MLYKKRLYIYKVKQQQLKLLIMKMFKVTKKNSWTDSKGNVRNWIKYMKSNNIEKVILHFGTDNILKVEEI